MLYQGYKKVVARHVGHYNVGTSRYLEVARYTHYEQVIVRNQS